MDEDVRMFLEQLHERLKVIEADIKKLHTPGDCPLHGRIRDMEMASAKQQGMMTIVGAISGMVAAAMLNAVLAVWKR